MEHGLIYANRPWSTLERILWGDSGFLWNFCECRLFFFFFWKGFFGKVLIWWSKFRYRDLFTNFDWLVVYLVFFSSWGKKNFYIGINKVGYFEEDIVIALCVLWYLFNLWRKTWNFIILPLKKNLLSNWSEYSRSLLLFEIRGEKMKSLNYGCFLSK